MNSYVDWCDNERCSCISCSKNTFTFVNKYMIGDEFLMERYYQIMHKPSGYFDYSSDDDSYDMKYDDGIYDEYDDDASYELAEKDENNDDTEGDDNEENESEEINEYADVEWNKHNKFMYT